ncbi:hypothetical protein HMPREF3229_00541 [Peptoniphilus harei]|uniref:Uncharacterized protein n=1 Tax=Peptoniphilus harei TaxID=54005 RepID=A0A133PQL2_9FIRM|nr:hypothetical protein HMPREF3229_00541 [Peptoniphilus harei]
MESNITQISPIFNLCKIKKPTSVSFFLLLIKFLKLVSEMQAVKFKQKFKITY